MPCPHPPTLPPPPALLALSCPALAPHKPCTPPAPPLHLAQALRRTSLAMESLLYTVQAEGPDTAATLRLSGMELADCIQEVGALR